MPEPWYALSQVDLAEALDYAAAVSGRPAHLLEKDRWAAWALSAIYAPPCAEFLRIHQLLSRDPGNEQLTANHGALLPIC